MRERKGDEDETLCIFVISVSLWYKKYEGAKRRRRDEETEGAKGSEREMKSKKNAVYLCDLCVSVV